MIVDGEACGEFKAAQSMFNSVSCIPGGLEKNEGIIGVLEHGGGRVIKDWVGKVREQGRMLE